MIYRLLVCLSVVHADRQEAVLRHVLKMSCVAERRPNPRASVQMSRFGFGSQLTTATMATMEAVLKTQTVAHWMDRFGGYVPAAPVYDIAQAFENPYVAEIEMVYETEHPGMENGTIRLMSSPYKVNGERLKGGIAPALGADTGDLLGGRSLG